MNGAIAFAAAAAAASGRSQIIAQIVEVQGFGGQFVEAQAGVRFASSGKAIALPANSELFDWVRPLSAVADWEIRATRTGGVEPFGPLGSWLSLAGNPEWSLIRSSAGTFTSVLRFEFRRVGATDPEVTINNNVLTVEVLG